MPPVFMAWSDLTITRADIDNREGTTFEQYDEGGDLGLATNDAAILAECKKEMADDIIRTMFNNEYDQPDDSDYTEAELLDQLEIADERDILKRMLAYKFLWNWFYQDSTKEDSLSYTKAREYAGKYYRELNGGLASLSYKMDTPRNIPRYKMVRV